MNAFIKDKYNKWWTSLYILSSHKETHADDTLAVWKTLFWIANKSLFPYI